MLQKPEDRGTPVVHWGPLLLTHPDYWPHLSPFRNEGETGSTLSWFTLCFSWHDSNWGRRLWQARQWWLPWHQDQFSLGHTMKGKLITTLLASNFSFWPSYVNSFALPSPPFCLFISEVHPADKLHIIQPWFGSRLSWEIGTDRGAASPAQQLP